MTTTAAPTTAHDTEAAQEESVSHGLDGAHWRGRLEALVRTHRIPGASLAIGTPHGSVDAAAGVLNLRTGTPATADSVFQIGSISKVWTATQIMQLVDQGKLTLETKVVEILPELRLAEDGADEITIQHLLTHTSGIDGDFFVDTGRGDDCVEKYVTRLAEVGLNHPVGATFSYCNAGYALMGRIVEVITGKQWDVALKDSIITPLGLPATVTLPEEVLLLGGAIGHVGKPGETPIPTTTLLLPRNMGPAGLISARPADVVAFAAMHLAGGVAPDGTRLLSQESVDAMQQKLVEVPDRGAMAAWGLGWIHLAWGDSGVFGHDGNTIGQAAFLRIHPASGTIVCLLTNGGEASKAAQTLFTEIFADLADVQVPPTPQPPAETPVVDLEQYVGMYRRASVDSEVLLVDGALRMKVTATGVMAELEEEPTEIELTPLATDGRFLGRIAGDTVWMAVTFYALADGSRYVHYGVRATPLLASR